MCKHTRLVRTDCSEIKIKYTWYISKDNIDFGLALQTAILAGFHIQVQIQGAYHIRESSKNKDLYAMTPTPNFPSIYRQNIEGTFCTEF